MSQPDVAFAHRLALHLGMTVGELGERMTADEFGRWGAFFELEGIAPGGEAIHRAAVLTALHNGPCTPPGGRQGWRLRDFLPRFPWEPERKKKDTAPKRADLQRLTKARHG